LTFAKIFSAISSAISWCGLSPSCDANSLTMIGGLMWMIFCGSASGSAGAAATGSATATGASGCGGGAGGTTTGPGAGSAVPRILEIGGRKEARLGAGSPSGRFGRGFFSSIKDTVSMTGLGFAVSAGLAV
jgi:hypothetical protein